MTERAYSFPPKQDVVGTGISLLTFDELMASFDSRPRDRATIVTITNVHAVMTARRDPELRRALDGADITTPDGMPIAWALRSMGNPDQERVYGAKVTTTALETGLDRDWRHYFYGSTVETLDNLRAALKEQYEGIEIAGTHSPPFRDLDAAEEDAVAAEIMETKPDFVWVGLGMPKQEKWMLRNKHRYPGVALVGIGAAFDFIAGTKPEAPAWMQKAGLEWVFRLASEPRRLWRRYIFNNPAYLLAWAKQAIGWKLRNRKG
jgi:N-acetylglucosaminyldiphosphoundecaprenol N-acetyl-beta-D-mannosaminyltransferase